MIKKSEINRGEDYTDLYLVSLPETKIDDLEKQVNVMFDELSDNGKHMQYERIFIANSQYVNTVKQIRERYYRCLGVEPPATSYIIAPPCNGAKVGMVAIGVRPNSDKKLNMKTVGDDFYNRGRIIDYDGFRQMYVGNVAGFWKGRLFENLIPQIWQAFMNLNDLLKVNEFDFKRDMVRMWFSITAINRLRLSGRTNYMDFNEDVRAPFLDKYLGFEERYFASTGVGNSKYNDGRFAEISAIAYENNGTIQITYMENPNQMPVYKYTQCKNPNKEQSMVRFERGMQVITPTVVQYIVSGTASIIQREVIGNRIEEQTITTIELVRKLLEKYYGKLSDAIMVVTYVKPGQDAKIVESILNDKGIGPAKMPNLIVFDELCYRPLLVETELFATVPLSEYNRRKAKAT